MNKALYEKGAENEQVAVWKGRRKMNKALYEKGNEK